MLFASRIVFSLFFSLFHFASKKHSYNSVSRKGKGYTNVTKKLIIFCILLLYYSQSLPLEDYVSLQDTHFSMNCNARSSPKPKEKLE
jgi:ABC-type arginine transport system permease subunit